METNTQSKRNRCNNKEFFLLIVLFGFLNIKSVKIYAIPYIFSTTLLLYKLGTLLLKLICYWNKRICQYLDITGFFFRIRTHVKALVLHYCMHLGLHLSIHAEKETRYMEYGPLLLFQWYCILLLYIFDNGQETN